MKYFDLYASYRDPTIAAAWESQVKETNDAPWLSHTLATCESELFSRFAACYAELRVLPRSARRALQRRLSRSSELAAILPEYLQHRGRRLQHRMAWSLTGAALLLALGHGVATAATITVTTNNPNAVLDGQCSLIEAIVNANNDATTHADCVAGSGADTIALPANASVTLSAVYGLTSGQFGNPVGLPPITSRITIEGNGATIARQGNAPAFGLMVVWSNFSQPPTPGDLTLQSVTLSGGSSFGALSNLGTLSIKNSTISGNTDSGVRNSGTLTIEDSTISNNTAGFGGGLYNSGNANIINSTISGNTAGLGGGIGNYGGHLTITNSTISGNTGGGVFNSAYYAFIPGCCPGTLTLNRSLIAGNQAAGPEIENATTMPLNTVTANNFNLFGTNGNAGVSGFTPGPTDIVPNVPLAQILGSLQNNGGSTLTHALVAGSPAIDAGDPGGCRDSVGTILTTDQRGFLRLSDGNFDGTSRCDIGAYELGSILAATSSTFVRQQYLDFLDRDPEAAGLAGWVNALDGGLPRASLIEAFMDSEEFFSKGKFIAQTYLGLLTRDADYSGYRAWLEVLLAGVSHEQIVQWFLDSDEFTIRFGSSLTNSQFIERMYNNVLLRSADPGGFNFWVGQLTSGQMTRAQVALGFLDSDEFQNLSTSQNEIDVSLLYFSMLRRDPDPGGFAGWVGALNSGVPLNSVIDGFLNSPEYQAGF